MGFNQAKTSSERAQYYGKLSGFRSYQQAHKLDVAHAAYDTDWFMPAIRELVTTANIIAKNGVIHVLDTVLVPE